MSDLKGTLTLAALIFTLGCFLPSRTACARTPPGGSKDSLNAILVLDLTTHEKDGSSVNRCFFFPDRGRIKARASEGTDCQGCTNALAILNSRLTNKQKLSSLSALSVASNNRWQSKKDQILGIWVFSNSSVKVEVKVDEKIRTTRLAADLVTFIKIASRGGLPGRRTTDSPHDFELVHSFWTLQHSRANLTATTTAAVASRDVATAPDTLQAVLDTGPSEHWFLSVDIPVNRVDDITLNDAGAPVSKEKPTGYLIGTNFMLGDLLAEGPSRNRLLSGLTFGLGFEPSSHPANSLGLYAGYRLPSGLAQGIETELFSPFVGLERVVHESRRSDGTTKRETVFKFVAGLSFNLDKALAWVGPGKD